MLYGTSELLNISNDDIPRYATITRIIETKLNLENVGAGEIYSALAFEKIFIADIVSSSEAE